LLLEERLKDESDDQIGDHHHRQYPKGNEIWGKDKEGVGRW
jgi:hypothetical protein